MGVKYDPLLELYAFPLEVGKTWSSSHRFLNTVSNAFMTFSSNSTVEAWEVVQTAAGPLKALRIRNDATWHMLAGSFSFAGRGFRTVWYSPDLAQAVRAEERLFAGGNRTRDTVEELLAARLASRAGSGAAGTCETPPSSAERAAG